MDLSLIKSKLKELDKNSSSKDNKEYKKVDYFSLYWKPQEEGEYQIRILPSKSNPDFPFTEVSLHYGFAKFPVYSLTNWGEKDPIVEFSKSLRETNESEKWTLAKKIEPKSRYFAQVIVRGEEEKGARLWEFGKQIYQQLLDLADDEDYGDYTDINEGIDFTVKAKRGEIAGRKNVLLSTITPKRKNSKLSKDAKEIKTWLKEQKGILELQTPYKKDFDSIKEILKNWLSPEDAEGSISSEVDDDDKEKSKPTKRGKDKKKKNKSEEFEAAFDFDEDEDEDELNN